MAGSYSRRKIEANAGSSQLRVDAEINHQEVASDGQSASSAVKIGWKTPANSQWARPFANTDAGAARTWRYHALRSHFRVRAGQTRTLTDYAARLRPCGERSPRRHR